MACERTIYSELFGVPFILQLVVGNNRIKRHQTSSNNRKFLVGLPIMYVSLNAARLGSVAKIEHVTTGSIHYSKLGIW